MANKNNKVSFRTSPVTVSVLEHALFEVTQEMTQALFRTSRSPILVEAKDFGCAITNAKGEVVAISVGLPIHSVGLDLSVQACLRYFGDEIYPGDIFFLNDALAPHYASGHYADFVTLMPVFYKDEMMFWTVERGHQADTGNALPGAGNVKARTMYEEGLKVPPVKLFERGKRREDMWGIIFRQLRMQATIAGDLHAAIGSVKTGAKRLIELIEKHGLQTMRDGTVDMLEYTETLMRAEIEKLPDGSYSAERWTDGDVAGGPYRLFVTVTIKGDSIIVDWTGSSPQSAGACNSALGNTTAASMTAILPTIARRLPINGGCFRPIKVIAPGGSIVNPLAPAAVNLGTTHPFNEILNCMWGALAQASPEKAIGDWSRCSGTIVTGTDPRTKEMFSGIEFHSGGGGGATWGTDGWSFMNYGNALGGGAAEEHEIYETTYPHMLLYHRLAKDSGGPGKWRGGLGVEVAWVSEAPGENILLPYADGFRTGVEGACGGMGPVEEAEFGYSHLIKFDGSKVITTQKDLFYYEQGDTFYFRTNGGGGVGPPLERDIEAVKLDVMNEMISIGHARKYYGVVFKDESWPYTVDYEATKKLREKIKGDNL